MHVPSATLSAHLVVTHNRIRDVWLHKLAQALSQSANIALGYATVVLIADSQPWNVAVEEGKAPLVCAPARTRTWHWDAFHRLQLFAILGASQTSFLRSFKSPAPCACASTRASPCRQLSISSFLCALALDVNLSFCASGYSSSPPPGTSLLSMLTRLSLSRFLSGL
jgi:hypothetical protein